MARTKRPAIVHPGQVLGKDFLDLRGITAYRLAKETGIPQTRVGAILKQRRRISADTALRFSRFFGTTPQFWMQLQTEFDLGESREKLGPELDRIQPSAKPRSKASGRKVATKTTQRPSASGKAASPTSTRGR